jgi:hypothetical protein
MQLSSRRIKNNVLEYEVTNTKQWVSVEKLDKEVVEEYDENNKVVFMLECILDHDKRDGTFLTKWKHYPKNFNTWETKTSLNLLIKRRSEVTSAIKQWEEDNAPDHSEQMREYKEEMRRKFQEQDAKFQEQVEAKSLEIKAIREQAEANNFAIHEKYDQVLRENAVKSLEIKAIREQAEANNFAIQQSIYEQIEAKYDQVLRENAAKFKAIHEQASANAKVIQEIKSIQEQYDQGLDAKFLEIKSIQDTKFQQVNKELAIEKKNLTDCQQENAAILLRKIETFEKVISTHQGGIGKKTFENMKEFLAQLHILDMKCQEQAKIIIELVDMHLKKISKFVEQTLENWNPNKVSDSQEAAIECLKTFDNKYYQTKQSFETCLSQHLAIPQKNQNEMWTRIDNQMLAFKKRLEERAGVQQEFRQHGSNIAKITPERAHEIRQQSQQGHPKRQKTEK